MKKLLYVLMVVTALAAYPFYLVARGAIKAGRFEMVNGRKPNDAELNEIVREVVPWR